MTREEVKDFVNNGLVYKPGWEFSTEQEFPTYYRFNEDFARNVIEVYVSAVVPDSDRLNAMRGWPRMVNAGRTLYLRNFEEKTYEEVLREIFDQLMAIELHESREFFKDRRRDWLSPFHPHTSEGQHNYHKTETGKQLVLI